MRPIQISDRRRFRYLSNKAERLGGREALESLLMAVTGGFGTSTLSAEFSRSAICRFTRFIRTTNFFDSWSLSACLHIF
jgi:hypothetical protein